MVTTSTPARRPATRVPEAVCELLGSEMDRACEHYVVQATVPGTTSRLQAIRSVLQERSPGLLSWVDDYVAQARQEVGLAAAAS